MMRFFVLCLIAFGFGLNVNAQTPQQIEMLKGRGDIPSDRKGFFVDEKTGELFIPQNTNPPTIEAKDGTMMQAPMAKTDDEVRATRRGPRPALFNKMNQDQRARYLDYISQDRIFISTADFRVITTVTGLKYCQMRLTVFNNTPRILNKIHINYSWGDTSTFAEFTNLSVKESTSTNIALAGSVCDLVTDGAKYDVTECIMAGLTQDQCLLRIAEM